MAKRIVSSETHWRIIHIFSAGSAMHRVKDANPLRETDNFGRSKFVDEKAAEEERFRVAVTLQIPVEERDDTTAIASIATELLQPKTHAT